MGALAVVMLIFLVLAVIAFFVFMIGLLTKSTAAGHVDPVDAAESAHHVHYLVPRGQDPAVVRTALSEAGYGSASEVEPDGEVLTIVLNDGTAADVERVREVLAETQDTTLVDPAHTGHTEVRFLEDAR